jgi:hypothetical protein
MTKDVIPMDTTNDVSVDVQAEPEMTPMDSTMISMANTNRDVHTLTDMVERFVVIDNFKWSSTATQLQQHYPRTASDANSTYYLKKYLFPEQILSNSSLIRQKLNNFMLMKADLEIDIKVNATPFQQGALLVSYYPRTTDNFKTRTSESLASVTSAPNRILQLEEGNSITMTLPYANEADYFDLTDSDDQFGGIYLYVIAPISEAVSPTEADVTVRARFVNVELAAPTDNSILTQTKYIDIEMERLQHHRSRVVTRRGMDTHFYGQAGKAEGEVGIVSKVSDAVGTVAGALSGVPVIGGVAKTVNWVSRAVGGVASVFGLSKPTELLATHRVVSQPATQMANFEGKDTSIVLGGIADNAIDTSSMIPSKVDEMSLEYMFARPSIIKRTTVSKTQFTGKQLLMSFDVAPVTIDNLQSDNKTLTLSAFSYAACFGLYWRGSIEYALQITKTVFHSGRFMAVYFPNTSSADLPATYSESMTTNLNVIYDLKAKADEEHSLEKPLVIPYTSNAPWKRTLKPSINGMDVYSADVTIGSVGIYALNELVAPDTVSDEITLLLRQKGGKDFEIAVPSIQMRTGYASSPSTDEDVFLADLNAAYANVYQVDAEIGALSKPIYDVEDVPPGSTNFVAINPSGSIDWSWVNLVDLPTTLADGVYTFNLFVDFQVAEITSASLAFGITVTDGKYESVTTSRLEGTSSDVVRFNIRVSKPVFYGQNGEYDEANSEEVFGAITSTRSISSTTTGEYLKSARALIKRFVQVADFSSGHSFTPVYQHTDDAGFRSYDTKTNVVNEIGESWMSIVSNLFRFHAGSVRYKLFSLWNDEITAAARISNSVKVGLAYKGVDPAYSQVLVSNGCVEIQIPYYGTRRARVVGDDTPKTSLAGMQVFTTGTRFPTVYEAAGDDYSFWFLVGPPVMTHVNFDFAEKSEYQIKQDSKTVARQAYVSVLE